MGSETVKGRARGLRQGECFPGEGRKRQVKPLIFQHRKSKRKKRGMKKRGEKCLSYFKSRENIHTARNNGHCRQIHSGSL